VGAHHLLDRLVRRVGYRPAQVARAARLWSTPGPQALMHGHLRQDVRRLCEHYCRLDGAQPVARRRLGTFARVGAGAYYSRFSGVVVLRAGLELARDAPDSRE